MFFSTLSRKNTNSSLLLLNILEILTVTYVYRLHALKFIYGWDKGTLPELFNNFFSGTLAMYIIITPEVRSIIIIIIIITIIIIMIILLIIINY